MTSILTRDLLMNMLLGLVAVVILVLYAINPKADADPIAQPGQLLASITWPAGDTDVDLWVQYADQPAVGYKFKSGQIWSLLRDDLGTKNDSTPLNSEFATTRGLPDGEYAINAQCYQCQTKTPVFVEVRLAEGGLVYTGTVELAPRQERTAVRFRVAGGAVVLGSESSVFKKMRRD